MPSKCAIFGCDEKSSKDSNILFHTFPKNSEFRQKWVMICRRADKFNPDNARICSRHFEEGAYKRNLRYELLNLPIPRMRKRLEVNALPTLHLPVLKVKEPEPSSSQEGCPSESDAKLQGKKPKRRKQFKHEEPRLEAEDPLDVGNFQDIKIEENDPLSEPFPEEENVVFPESTSFKQERDSWADKPEQVEYGEPSNDAFSHEEFYSEMSEEIESDIMTEEVYLPSEEITDDPEDKQSKRKGSKQQKNSSKQKTTGKRHRKILLENPESNPYEYIQTNKDIYDTFGLHIANTLRDINDLIVFNRVKIIIGEILLDALAGHFSDPVFEKYFARYLDKFRTNDEEISDAVLPVSSTGHISSQAAKSKIVSKSQAAGSEILSESQTIGCDTFLRTELSAQNRQDRTMQMKLSSQRKKNQKAAQPNVLTSVRKDQENAQNPQCNIPQDTRISKTAQRHDQISRLAVNPSTLPTTQDNERNPSRNNSTQSEICETPQTMVQCATSPTNTYLNTTQACIFDSYDRISPLSRTAESTRSSDQLERFPGISPDLNLTPQNTLDSFSNISQYPNTLGTDPGGVDIIETSAVTPCTNKSSHSRSPVFEGNEDELSQLMKKRKR